MGKQAEPQIRRYTPQDEESLFALLRRAGEEWEEYFSAAGRPKYRRALESSIVYLAFAGGQLCAYARCREDDGFGLYVYDLLVDRACRGREYGRHLTERAAADFPAVPTYVMSDADGYCTKLGYEKEGTIFIVGRA